jgi:hypothetical protein
MHPLLGETMLRWRVETAYAGESDWVFASFKLRGKQPREGNMIGADYLRPAIVRAGVLATGDKRRFGWHNFRHSATNRGCITGVTKITGASYVIGRDGRHEETRTPDLYRVKVAL